MDLEAIQILNLSPIPELSEIELSTMLEHLSGLSDINGDVTDRNVEDILKEAEDLLDKSSSSKTQESKSVNKSPEPEEKIEISQHINNSKDKEQNLQASDVEESKQQTISVSSNSQMNTISEHDKHNSSVENSSILYSPGSSSNPIKSTIDSLKEFSTLIEKKLAKFQNSSPKHIETSKDNQNGNNDKVTFSNNSLNKKSVNTKIVETQDSIPKKNVTDPLVNSVKLLNCFERLYRDKPGRLNSKKVVDKLPKTVIKKKFSKDLKNKKNNWQGQTKKNVEECVNVKSYQNASPYFQQTLYGDEVTKPNQISKHLSHDECSELNYFSDNFQNYDDKFVQPQMDEKLMLKVLEGMEEIKDQVKKVGGENLEKITKEDNKGIEILTLNSEKDVFEQDFQNSGIKRLEEQFCILKEKYNHQIDKLEAENLKLREALNRQQETFTSQDFLKVDNGGTALNPWSPEKKLSRTFSLENFKAPKNSPCSSSENFQTSTTVKEASSQTEKSLKNISIQCEEEIGTNRQSETKKTENKENLISKKKFGKCKPFSDLNVGIRQKKATEHETQLLATLRGLQAEVTAKDKENRKLKSEIESLKRQMKKIGNVKMDCRRCNIGTQTIGLGAFLHKPYNPENFEVPYEFEKENEDLRSRIKALEEDFEFLKEKRITDLQSLHQVHEEEMAKLVSKLETQSALTKHLHSLLVNR